MENVLPNIFKAPIVSHTIDGFWETAKAGALKEKDTLVISAHFESGSAEETQLLRMLGACKLTDEHYQVIKLGAEEKIAWHQLREFSKASKVLLLGILPAQLGISAMMVPNEVNHFDGAQWMPSFSLDQIAANDALKKHLWVNVFQKLYF